jgi:hypothetical protein
VDNIGEAAAYHRPWQATIAAGRRLAPGFYRGIALDRRADRRYDSESFPPK